MSEEDVKEELSDEIKALIEEKPTTVTGAWQEVGKELGVSRSTVDKELDTLARMGEINVEKPLQDPRRSTTGRTTQKERREKRNRRRCRERNETHHRTFAEEMDREA